MASQQTYSLLFCYRFYRPHWYVTLSRKLAKFTFTTSVGSDVFISLTFNIVTCYSTLTTVPISSRTGWHTCGFQVKSLVIADISYYLRRNVFAGLIKVCVGRIRAAGRSCGQQLTSKSPLNNRCIVTHHHTPCRLMPVFLPHSFARPPVNCWRQKPFTKMGQSEPKISIA
jgi:hypothetical protein